MCAGGSARALAARSCGPHRCRNDTWNPRLDVIEALEADGWTGNALAGEALRKNGALWTTVHDGGESGLDGPGGYVIPFTPDVPAVVIVAACLAASRTPA